MRLGRDVLVLTQRTNSRSLAFLSESLNEGKDVSYTILWVFFSFDLMVVDMKNDEPVIRPYVDWGYFTTPKVDSILFKFYCLFISFLLA